MEYVVGVDIGGSHITVATVDMERKSFVKGTETRRRVDCHGRAVDIIDNWATAIEYSFLAAASNDDLPRSSLNDRDSWKIGIAMPGPFEYEEGISRIKGFNKYDELYGLNVKELLGEKLRISSSNIKLKNDAACFLDGELFAGAGRSGREVLGITLGTGFGTAFGRNGRAKDAELSQTAFLDSRAEDYFSTKWFIDAAKKENVTIKGVMDLLKQPDCQPVSMKLFELFSSNLALFFEHYLSKYPHPDIVVLGGNIAQAKSFFMEPLQSALKQRGITLNIQISTLGESAALLGAASLWQVKSMA